MGDTNVESKSPNVLLKLEILTRQIQSKCGKLHDLLSKPLAVLFQISLTEEE